VTIWSDTKPWGSRTTTRPTVGPGLWSAPNARESSTIAFRVVISATRRRVASRERVLRLEPISVTDYRVGSETRQMMAPWTPKPSPRLPFGVRSHLEVNGVEYTYSERSQAVLIRRGEHRVCVPVQDLLNFLEMAELITDGK